MSFFVFKQKTAYELRISDWSSDVCSSDLDRLSGGGGPIVLRPSRRIVALGALHHAIGDRIRAVGLRPRAGYRFQPHLTVGYRNGLALNESTAPVAWRATDIVLIHSHVGRTRHDLVGRWPLTGAVDSQLSLW